VQNSAADAPVPKIQLGVAAAGERSLANLDASVTRDGLDVWFTFPIKPGEVIRSPEDWQHLRLAAQVTWLDGVQGLPRQVERFGTTDAAAAHAPLPSSDQWDACHLSDYVARVQSSERIVLAIDQPMTGKWTVVVDDAQGRRVRTLAAGAAVERGVQELEWDGLDDFGRLVSPGAYTWRSVHHPGIRPQYLMGFGNGDEPGLAPLLSNHGWFLAACTNSQNVFLAAPITEGGCSMIALDAAGRFQRDFRQAHGTGYMGVAVAADERHFYAVHDGMLRHERINKNRGDWATANFISLTRYDVATGNYAPYGKSQFEQVVEYEYGPGSDNPNTQSEVSLAGMVLLNGELIISARSEQALLALDPATGKITRKMPLAKPGALATDGRQLLAVSGEQVLRVDPATGQGKVLIKESPLKPAGLAIDASGRVYVSDRQSHTVRVFKPDGKPDKAIFGEPGGAYQGPFIAQRLVKPAGLAVFGDRLWITEDRVNPKRASAWDMASRQVVVQKFGNPPYGGPSSGMDPLRSTRWLGLGCVWELDYSAQTARPVSILQKDAGHFGGLLPLLQSYRFVHQDGRTFLLGSGKANVVSELMPDGSLRDLALISSPHLLLYAMNWKRVEAFCQPLEKLFPQAKFEDKYAKSEFRGIGVLWVDRNGDGLLQAEEFEFGPAGTSLAIGSWGGVFHDLTMRVPMTRADGSRALITLKPDGYLSGGAPNYPTLASALSAAVPVDMGPLPATAVQNLHQELALDQFGTLVVKSDPFMVGLGADGRVRWQYANRWSNVHGSHRAPLPSIGQMQGTISFLGLASLDEQGDVTVLNGNHGRFFVMTTDGFYLDEMFRDVRMGGANDDLHVGGEPFGGSFARGSDGGYYLQTGGNGFRIYQLHGLDQIKRQQGTVTVEAPTLLALARQARESQAAENTAVRALIRRAAKAFKIDGNPDEWPAANVSWSREGQFPVSVRCAYDDANLYLFYDVRDDSPWLNGGSDWTTLFKTGDSVDLQLGTDPAASPRRRDPAPGDLRLLVAPFQGKNTAVLYRYKSPGSTQSVTFTSPWRAVTVDSVTVLESAQIAVKTRGNGYVVEMAVPLKDLGLKPAGELRGDFGALYGDAAGQVISLRSFWSNRHTALVNDVPGEIMLQPDAWGALSFED
jgi:hypothetical protein